MGDQKKDIPWCNSRLVTENYNKFPAEELLKYAGQWVAWNLEGSQILASAAGPVELEQRLKELGIDPSRVIQGYEPTPAESLGGGFFSE